MKITCYGPRGSLPSPSTKTFKTWEYGGNTSCYYVEAGPFRIILDCGSGIRQLGNDLMASGEGFGKEFLVLLSHYHWDHIQGLPFCVPMFIANNRFRYHGFTPSGHERGPKPVVETMLADQQSNPHFPVAHSEMPAQTEYTDHARQFSESFGCIVGNGGGLLRVAPAEVAASQAAGEEAILITTIPLNHPDGCLGYRIEYKGKVLVYATDNEPLYETNAHLNKNAQEADWLLLDGQYGDDQLAGMTQTFGHGSPRACIDQALDCPPKLLVIHHHDPNNDDAKVAEMEAWAKNYATESGPHLPGRVRPRGHRLDAVRGPLPVGVGGNLGRDQRKLWPPRLGRFLPLGDVPRDGFHRDIDLEHARAKAADGVDSTHRRHVALPVKNQLLFLDDLEGGLHLGLVEVTDDGLGPQ
tara:strand:+ start:8465 stop:9697 length:1233 start_codon:yes stop_codon:yes gene_type:complete